MPKPSDLPQPRRIEADLYVDHDANAASISFAQRGGDERPRTVAVRDASGAVVATLDFSPEGRLLQLELLDLARQGLPEWSRW